MSIWTSSTSALLTVALLSGCIEAGGPGAPTRLAVTGGAVTIAGPDGYCIDRRSSHTGKDEGFVLMASCAAVSRNAQAPRPAVPALLTATIVPPEGAGGPVTGQMSGLKRYFGSATGRAALARDDRSDSVEIIDMATRDDTFVVHLRDKSTGLADGLSAEYWRAIFDLNGQIVTASVTGFKSRRLSDDAGYETLRAFVARIRAASAKTAPSQG